MSDGDNLKRSHQKIYCRFPSMQSRFLTIPLEGEVLIRKANFIHATETTENMLHRWMGRKGRFLSIPPIGSTPPQEPLLVFSDGSMASNKDGVETISAQCCIILFRGQEPSIETMRRHMRDLVHLLRRIRLLFISADLNAILELVFTYITHFYDTMEAWPLAEADGSADGLAKRDGSPHICSHCAHIGPGKQRYIPFRNRYRRRHVMGGGSLSAAARCRR